MKILGNRIYLSLPQFEDSKIDLSPEFKKTQKEEISSKLEKLTVFAIGDVNSSRSESYKEIKIGDEVFVDPNELKRGIFLRVEGKDKISVSLSSVMHIW